VRPPGHYATATCGMGFCIFNHVAISARNLQKKHGLKRIAIIDWDVHHGNGTEAIFISDPSLLYFSP
jgi:acetoin utilization deacetylase AcuC-like enzyme